MKTKILTRIGATLFATLVYTGCSSHSSKDNIVDLTDAFAKHYKSEFDRLWYFRAIDMRESRKALGYSGEGVRVTIMGEIVDATHPDLKNRINKQYNAFATKGEMLTGENNQPYGFDKIGHGSGHGTHIAGTIAAECDEKGFQGVACKSTIDVYALGAYDDTDKFELSGWGNKDDEFGMFLSSFAYALDDITKRGVSKITTGSFNLESPYFPLKAGGELENISVANLTKKIEAAGSIDKLLTEKFADFKDPNAKIEIKKLGKSVDDLQSYMFGIFAPKTKEWKALEESIHKYQQSGGVYITTESNNIFHKTSVFNALPTITDKVDKDLWISTVMITPEKFAEAKTPEDVDNALKGRWTTMINDCGEAAEKYCLLTPSNNVMSAMTQKVRESNMALLKIDGRYYQEYSGHSMGAPMIAGALALMLEKNKEKNYGYSMKELVTILKRTANRTFTGYDPKKHGQGILDVRKALEAIVSKEWARNSFPFYGEGVQTLCHSDLNFQRVI